MLSIFVYLFTEPSLAAFRIISSIARESCLLIALNSASISKERRNMISTSLSRCNWLLMFRTSISSSKPIVRAFLLFLFSCPLEKRRKEHFINLSASLYLTNKGSKEEINPSFLKNLCWRFYATGLFFLQPGTKGLNRSPEDLGNQPTTKKILLETKEGFSIKSYGNDCQRTEQKHFDYDPLATGFRPAQEGLELYLLSSRYRKLDLFGFQD